jgi:YYY domain-containing protein
MALNLLDIALWWLALEIIGLIALPIASHIGSNLKDRGYSISKPLGLLLITYLSWIISFLGFGYTSFSILSSGVIVAACSCILFWKKRPPLVEKNYFIKFEMIFFIAFAVFSAIRAYSPDIFWTGGEKFMDMTFINSLLRTSQFPPSDPWMSGTPVQYYYFGYLIVANLIKITGILPSIAFNLATASFFALSLTTAFGIGYAFTERIRYGIITAFFVTIAGNLVGFFQLMDILQRGDVVNNILSFNYWTSSRIIPDTINEFPFFSFLQGDVHAHMISISFQLLIIFLLLGIFKSGAMDAASIFTLGLSIGFLYPLNSWDYPVYLVLAIAILAFKFYLDFLPQRPSKKDLIKPILIVGALVLISYLLYIQYHLSYRFDRIISFVPSGRTNLLFYMAIYGLFLYISSRFILAKSKKYLLKPVNLLVPLVLILVLSVVLKFELLVLLVPLLVLSVISLLKDRDENHAFVLVLIIAGILVSFFCELFYIQDALGKGNPALIRLNTVFKFYLQNWILWGISTGVIVFQYRDSFSRKKTWGIVAAFLILMVSVYPVFATIGKSGGFRGEPTLDGEAWVKKQHPQEYMAIMWFRNLSGQPVVLQAPGELYQWNTYITAFTGLPTVIGWGGHELNWRLNSKEINTRWSDANTMYTSLSLEDVSALLKKYNVSYVYFGETEVKRYSSPRLFESHPERFEKVFEYGDVVVYKISYR